MTEATHIQPWIYLFLLPAAILFSLIGIGWVIKRIWQSQDDEDLGTGY